MGTKKIGESEKPSDIWEKQKAPMKTRQSKCKNALFTTIKTFILIFGIVTNAKANPQNNMYTPNNRNSNPYQHYLDIPPRNTLRQSQHIIFNAIGEMAAQMMYVHVNLPLNLTALYDQAQLLESYLYTLTNTTTSEFKRIPFTKAARNTGEFGLRRLARIMQKLENVDHNLPHVESRQKREEKKRKELKGEIKPVFGATVHIPKDVIWKTMWPR